LLRDSVVVKGPLGSRTVQLVGVTEGVVGLGGSATKDLGAVSLLLTEGVGVPSAVAEAIGVQTGQSITVLAGATVHTTEVRPVLDAAAIGALSSSGIVVTILRHAQAIAGKPGRVSEVLIRPRAGREGEVARELRSLAGDRLDVHSANAELKLVEETAKPTSQSSTLFAAIGLMVGFMLALNAMLLTLPERRRLFAELRSQGYDSRQAMLVFVFQALVLGVLASLAGVGIGSVLARTLLRETPLYLSVAFAVSGQQEIPLNTVLLAFGAGVVAALLAALLPIFDLVSKEPIDAVMHRPGEPGQAIGTGTMRVLAILGIALALGTVIAVIALPSLTVIGGVVLALVALCLVPVIAQGVTALLRYVSRKYHGGMLAVTVIEMEAATTRVVVLAAVAALAVYGSTSVGGARRDLLRGLDRATVEFFGTADVWVSSPTNDLGTTSFKGAGLAAKISKLPVVRSVRTYQAGLLDLGRHRVWLRARPPGDPAMLQASQIVSGDLAEGTARMRRGGGWVAISHNLAAERGLRVGSAFSLPTPSGYHVFRVAAITTNVGWPPGAITLNANDYRRWWQTTNPAALEIDLRPGVSPAEGRSAVQDLLGVSSGLLVQTAQERIAQFESNASAGLHTLEEISLLLLVTSALAFAAALSTAIYQRRTRLAALKAQGFDRPQLWRSLLLESVVVLGIGCLDGVILGIYGHALADRYLLLDTGFPAPFEVGVNGIFISLALIGVMSLVIVALPGYAAAGVPTRASFQE
ncbi:MAG TPA: ABC transporter permease, partial [Solirubrobacteraceae bacterium]|nr:ABC transporter permease [Solirubrobacteraceae bacterium]